MAKKKTSERGTVLVEYGLTVGLMALTAAAVFSNSATGVKGVWKQASAVSAKGNGAAQQSPIFLECMAGAHGDSQICASNSH